MRSAPPHRSTTSAPPAAIDSVLARRILRRCAARWLLKTLCGQFYEEFFLQASLAILTSGLDLGVLQDHHPNIHLIESYPQCHHLAAIPQRPTAIELQRLRLQRIREAMLRRTPSVLASSKSCVAATLRRRLTLVSKHRFGLPQSRRNTTQALTEARMWEEWDAAPRHVSTPILPSSHGGPS